MRVFTFVYVLTAFGGVLYIESYSIKSNYKDLDFLSQLTDIFFTFFHFFLESHVEKKL